MSPVNAKLRAYVRQCRTWGSKGVCPFGRRTKSEKNWQIPETPSKSR